MLDSHQPDKGQDATRFQLKSAAASFAVGTAVSLGSVLMARKVMPEQVVKLEKMIARILSKSNLVPEKDAAKASKSVADFALMNIGGTANMFAQYGLRQKHLHEDDLHCMELELARLGIGRIAGTAGAAAAVILAKDHAPRAWLAAEEGISKVLPLKKDTAAGIANSKEISELVVSDLVQAAGAYAPFVAAQLLFDKVVSRTQSTDANCR